MLQQLDLPLPQAKTARSKSGSLPFLRKNILGHVVHGLQEEADGSGLNQKLRGNLMPATTTLKGLIKRTEPNFWR